MINVKQISIVLDNHPGRLMEVAGVLAENNININAITVSESSDYAIVRIIVDNVLWTASVLKRAGFIASFTDVIAMEVPNVPGGLISVLKVMKGAGINIEYMYAVQDNKNPDNTCMVFKVSDIASAEYTLQAAGIKLLSQGELAEL